MKISIKSLVLTSLVAAIGFAAISNADAKAAAWPGYEKIYGSTTNGDGITFQVASGGCTKKEDFKVIVTPGLVKSVRLVRLKADKCEERNPYGVLLEYTYEELCLKDGDRFEVQNLIRHSQVHPPELTMQ